MRRIVSFTFFLCSLLAVGTFAQLTHELTIYVDEGHGKPNGHVWIGLSDGNKTSYHGFYPQNVLVSIPEVWEPGQIRDDSERVKDGQWDVKRTYRISNENYHRALDAINAWQNKDETRWTGLTHCGDFTEGIVRAAGIGLTLPWSAKGQNRPGVFGKYLRQHGGIVNTRKGQQEPVADEDKQNTTKDRLAKCAEAVRICQRENCDRITISTKSRAYCLENCAYAFGCK